MRLLIKKFSILEGKISEHIRSTLDSFEAIEKQCQNGTFEATTFNEKAGGIISQCDNFKKNLEKKLVDQLQVLKHIADKRKTLEELHEVLADKVVLSNSQAQAATHMETNLVAFNAAAKSYEQGSASQYYFESEVKGIILGCEKFISRIAQPQLSVLSLCGELRVNQSSIDGGVKTLFFDAGFKVIKQSNSSENSPGSKDANPIKDVLDKLDPELVQKIIEKISGEAVGKELSAAYKFKK